MSGNPRRERAARPGAAARALVRRVFAGCAALSMLAAGAPAAAQDSAPLELSSFPHTTLEIVHHGRRGVHRYPFQVWVADTPARAEQGLMFVSDLPAGRGMVFPLPAPRVETMWMKNTYIELDMLFIRADGRVASIIERAHPLSEELLSSGEPVSAVLELKGGDVQKLGLEVGDTVTWKKPAP
jgi:uncharacterized membrane protein (UPF0127 family)